MSISGALRNSGASGTAEKINATPDTHVSYPISHGSVRPYIELKCLNDCLGIMILQLA